jgi:hypothetical protein
VLRRLKRLAWGHSPDIETLSERLDGRLTPERERDIDAHVASCNVCESALSEMREARTLLSAMPTVDAPRSFRLRVADVEPASVPVRSGESSMMRWAPALSAAAVMVLVATIGVSQFSSGGGSAQLAATQADAPTGNLAAERAGTAPTTPVTSGGALAASPTTLAAMVPSDLGEPTEQLSQTARSSSTSIPGESADGAAGSVAGPQTDAATADAPAIESTDDAAAAGDSGVAEDGGDSGSESFAPPPAPATTAPLGVAPDGPDDDQPESNESVTSSDGDGNPDALFIVQIAAAVVAIVAAAGYVVWRFTRGGVAG